MLTRTILRLFFTTFPKQPQTPTHKSQQQTTTIGIQKRERTRQYMYRIKLHKIHEPTYFMQLINNQHSLKQTNKMLNAIMTGGTQINRNNFQNIFKKYCYYIEQIRHKQGYLNASLSDKFNFISNVTQIYQKLGRLSGQHMIKSINKICQQLLKVTQKQLSYCQQSQFPHILLNMFTLLCSISRYNKKKSIHLYKTLQPKLTTPKYLCSINKQISMLYMQLFTNMSVFNRLILQTCMDVLNKQIPNIKYQQLFKIIYCLAGSHIPVNRYFMENIIKRVNIQLNKYVDRKTGKYYPKNSNSLKQVLKLLDSLTLLEVNMKLASAYLNQLSVIYEIQFYELDRYIGKMNNRDLESYCRILRRSGYYDPLLLQSLINQMLYRNIKQLKQLDLNINQFTDGQTQKESQMKQISLNTLCSALHTLAVYNYRNTQFIQYFIKNIQLAIANQQLKSRYAIQNKNNEELMDIQNRETVKSKQNNFKNLQDISKILNPKHYGRVVWSICVLGTKSQISKIYPIFQNFFSYQYQNNEKSPKVYQTLNFYYCYLLLKTFFPKSTLSFQSLINYLQSQHLQSTISQNHLNIYKTIIQCGIPALKQHSISNLMCDIFIPKYTSQDQKYQIQNVIIDVHGCHHFIRNGNRVNGSSALKAKILKSQGYVYEYIGVQQWGLVSNKQQYIRLIMDQLAHEFGKQFKSTLNKKLAIHQNIVSQNNKSLSEIQNNQVQSQTTSSIKSPRKGRRISIKTNSSTLSSKINKKQQDNYLQ